MSRSTQHTIALSCPIHGGSLEVETRNDRLVCSSSCIFPVVRGIPRFVAEDGYASSFGLQWKEFRLTQLDSFTGTTISRDRLTRLVGGSLGVLRGKQVLEVGCGAGRFTEIMLDAGASVYAIDLSSAVEANYENFKERSNYWVLQADVLKLPFVPEQFDMVVCVGVIQHTENPERTIETLCSHVRPAGLLVFDHYTHGYPVTPSRRFLRSLLIRVRNKTRVLRFCKTMVGALWPIHRLLWRYHLPHVRNTFLKISPVVDYHAAYPQLSSDILFAWAMLDTHDTLTDYYKHLRSREEIEACLRKCGMTDIETVYAGNGVEARARKPEVSPLAKGNS
jgi:2-polyprenyl-3-methyl-5-hydroxy-6-metoxy-1,4-benzoquinol methylase